MRNLCEKAPEHLKWLDEMGVLFDRNEDDTWKVKASGDRVEKGLFIQVIPLENRLLRQ